MIKPLFLVVLFNLVALHALASDKDGKKAGWVPEKAKGYVHLERGEAGSPLVPEGRWNTPGSSCRRLCIWAGILWSDGKRFDARAGAFGNPGSLKEDEEVSPGPSGENLYLWRLDPEGKRMLGFGMAHDAGDWKVSNKPMKSVPLPCEKPTAAVAVKGGFLVLDATRGTLMRLDGNGKKLKEFPAPSNGMTDMARWGKYFWGAEAKRKALYLFDEHGVVILDVPLDFHPAGIASGGYSLWVSSEEGALHRFRFDPERKYSLGRWMEADIRFDVTGTGRCRIALPARSNRQEVEGEIRFSKPGEIIEDNWGQKAASFEGGGDIRFRSRMYAIRYFVLPGKVGSFEDIPGEILEAYTVDGAMLKTGSSQVERAADEVRLLIRQWRKEENPYWVARCAYEYLIRTVHYERIPGWVDAPTILDRGGGTCSPISFAYVAICRALGLPARLAAGTRFRRKDPCVDREFHRWCEVYLPNYGWVPVDPSSTGKTPTFLKSARHWGRVPETDLVMTRGGGGSTIFGWAYNGAGGRCIARWSGIRKSVEDAWFEVFLGKRRAGWARMTVNRIGNRDGTESTSTSFERRIILELRGKEYVLGLSWRIVRDATGIPVEAVMEIARGTSRRIFAGKMEGGKLRLLASHPVPGEGGPVLDGTAFLPFEPAVRFLLKDMKPGAACRYRTVIPGSMKSRKLLEVLDTAAEVLGEETVDISGKESALLRIRLREGERERIEWRNANGDLHKALEPGTLGGILMVRSDRKKALLSVEKIDIFEFMRMGKTETRLPRIREISNVLYRLSLPGADVGGIVVEDGRQKIEKREGNAVFLRVRKIEPGTNESRAFPCKDESMKEFLAPNRYLECEDPVLRKVALEIVGDEKDSWKAANLLGKWVFGNLRKGGAPGFLTAAQALEKKTGDCSEHGVLFTALLRAVGIPSKVVFGLTYHEGGFYCHVWTEAYIGSSWIAMDCIQGQANADPGHIKLRESSLKGVEDLGSLMKVVEKIGGRLKIEVLEYELGGKVFRPNKN